MNTKTIALALAMLPVALGGCTQQSTLGNAISSEGAAIAAIGTETSVRK